MDKKDTVPADVVMPINVGKPLKRSAKLTPAKRKKVLEYLAHDWNMTAAAAQVGVTRMAISHLANRDERFREALQAVHDAYLDSIESVSVSVARIPSREGFQDRKLQLQAHRKEYAVKPVEINQAIQINIDNAPAEARQILDGMAVNID